MTPRQGFIAACIEMVELDEELTADELRISQEILKKQGFTEEEFEAVINLPEEETTEEKIFTAIQGLDEKMKKQLVENLRRIATSDGTDSEEFQFIQRVEKLFGLPVDE
jgi:uncharacterized tellurite resistance protein B-like protein